MKSRMRSLGWPLALLAIAPVAAVSAQGAGVFGFRAGDSLSAPTPAGEVALLQPPTLKGCDREHLTVGFLAGAGEVSYLITADGKADTATVKVVDHQGLSEAGLNSVAHRLLATCRFKPAVTSAGKVPALVTGRLVFGSGRDIASSAPKEHLSAMASGDSGLGVRPIAAGAIALWSEEAPAVTRCHPFYNPTGGGTLFVTYIIGVDGRVEPGTIQVKGADTKAQLKAAQDWAQSCEYTAPRTDGVPVRLQRSDVFEIR